MSGPKCLNYEVDERLRRERSRRDRARADQGLEAAKLVLLNEQCQALGLVVSEPPAHRSETNPGDDMARQADMAEAELARWEEQARRAAARLEQYHRETEQRKVQHQQQQIQLSLARLASIPSAAPPAGTEVTNGAIDGQGQKQARTVELERDKKAVLQQKLARTLDKLQAPTVAHQQLVAEITVSSPARAGLLLRELDRDVTEFNKCWERARSVVDSARELMASAANPETEAEAKRLVRDAEQCWDGEATVEQLHVALETVVARLQEHQGAHPLSGPGDTQIDTVPSFVAETLAECLGELGYTVSDMGGQTARSQLLVPLQTESSAGHHGIQVEVDEQEINMRAVRVGGQPDTGEDRAAEEALCSQLEYVKQGLATRGVKISRVRGAAVGVVPMMDLRPPRQERPAAVAPTQRIAPAPAARRAPTLKSMGGNK